MTPVTTLSGTKVYKSRWGYHPCDHETYLKLKAIYKRYWEVLKQIHAWRRWKRKEPQNRVIRKWLRDEAGRKIGCEILGSSREPQVDWNFINLDKVNGFVCWNDHRVTPEELRQLAALFQRCRVPMDRPDDLGSMEEWDLCIDRWHALL